MAWLRALLIFLHLMDAPVSPQTPNTSPAESQTVSTPAQTLYEASKGFIGIDLTPDDQVPDYVACVAQFQECYRRTFGHHVGTGAALYNTRALRDALKADPSFVPGDFETAKPGDVCVFASGESPVINHGHVFIVGKVDWMSNNSQTGRWEAHKVKTQVVDYYMKYARFIPYVFRPV